MQPKVFVFAVSAALVLNGCATVTRGTTDQVQLLSTPAGARASTTLGQGCTTPCTIIVGRKDEFTVSFQKDGYVPQEIPVKTQVSGNGALGFAGNILAGGVVGMAADAATGATLDHVPNPVRADLVPAPRLAPRVLRRPAHRRGKPIS
ncbi:MAG TPA: translation initiation factor 2 [Beijerinckiaceae bacterium]|nr:translation initiation factor 2 [Beijerinckiaceae bacterium]